MPKEEVRIIKEFPPQRASKTIEEIAEVSRARMKEAKAAWAKEERSRWLQEQAREHFPELFEKKGVSEKVRIVQEFPSRSKKSGSSEVPKPWEREIPWQEDAMRLARKLDKLAWEFMFHHPHVTFGEVKDFLEKAGLL